MIILQGEKCPRLGCRGDLYVDPDDDVRCLLCGRRIPTVLPKK